jgi:hypothetical protein
MIFAIVNEGYLQCQCSHHDGEHIWQKIENKLHACENCRSTYFITDTTLKLSKSQICEVAGEVARQ